ncbi:hypothetical protein [Microbaculum marinisediminis]|uniref:UspA domain-containing protein n=1 Tax=Microbaculum marinisediminis TaxID=2931392 RepID=A0AAW5R4G1_9HYPH|nr:hypothetical protein [Microbaculum sp. A6E488]MCT8974823.1 hypothetical protein [Microbaculum sp. A6E488]
MTARIAYKRVVMGLHQSTPDRTTVRLAAEFAGLLRLDLMGLFIEDPGMLAPAQRPGAREFQLLGRRWRPLEPQSLTRDIELCALSARRMLDETAKTLGVPSRFEVVRAALREAMKAVSQASDIVIIAEPHNPAERAIAPFPQLVKAAFESAATVLYLPRRIARARGPVVAIATSPDDPSLATAETIAAAAQESLIVIEAFKREAEAAPDSAGAAGIPVARLSVARSALGDIRSLSSAIDGLRERMIVVTRGAFGEGDGDKPAALAALQSVPLLLVEPAGAPASEPANEPANERLGRPETA